MSHSPAPWAIVPLARARDDDHCGGIVDAKGEFIVETDSGYYAPILADARLMVAAPDLLSAARQVFATLTRVDLANDSLIWAEERELLHAAITKADPREL